MKREDLKRVKTFLEEGMPSEIASQKPFAMGMYRFSMFMISYYTRVREQLKIDYDSFMIVQTVVSHILYNLNKRKNSSKSFLELEKEWENLITKKNNLDNEILDLYDSYKNKKPNYRLSISSICLVTNLPKETVRRKVNELVKKDLLKSSKEEGIVLGPRYRKVFSDYVPETTYDVSRLLKDWKKIGVLDGLLSFKTDFK